MKENIGNKNLDGGHLALNMFMKTTIAFTVEILRALRRQTAVRLLQGAAFAFLGATSVCAEQVAYPPADKLTASKGKMTYLVDPENGNDSAPPGKPWRSFARINALKLAPGDQVIISSGTHSLSLKPSGEGTQAKPVVFRFLPGVHVISPENAVSEPMYVSNATDTAAPKPIALLVRGMRHVRFEGEPGPNRPVIMAGGRMVQVFNDHSEDITYTGLAFDLKRPTVSEFRVLEASGSSALIALAEGSDYTIKDDRFLWAGEYGSGKGMEWQEMAPKWGFCWRRNKAPRGWQPTGQLEAKATDMGDRRVRLEFPDGETGLTVGHQFHFRNSFRDRVSVHNARCARITFRDCSVYALVGMGFVSQFTDTITYQRVDVVPPPGTLRTCPAWADIFQFSNCKGDILVDGCRLSGMCDDAINCHGTHLRIIEAAGPQQVVVRFMHRQTYGFAAFTPGDEVAVINASTLREYDGNPRRKVTAVEQIDPQNWRVTFDGPVPRWEKEDAIDNITWHPRFTAINNDVSMTSVRCFLITTRGKSLIEGNTFHRPRMPSILVENDASGWFESGPVRDLTIRGNRFIGGGIKISPHAKVFVNGEPVHENIQIIGNYFFENSNVDAKGTGNLVITGNISSPKPLPINIDPSCSGVLIENNTVAEKAATNK